MVALAVLSLAATAGAAPFTVDCSSPPSYPIAGTPLFDFDANCGMDLVALNWTDRTNKVWANISSVGAVSRTVDVNRGLARYIISQGKKLTIPVDISPSKYPSLTLEYVLSILSPTTNSATKVLLATDPEGTPLTGVSHGRAIAIYMQTGSGTFIQPWCSAVLPSPAGNTAKTPPGSGYMHLTFVFFPNGNVTWYVNGVFSSNVTGCGIVDGAANITVGGRAGTSDADHTSSTMAYIRAWPRALSASEVVALALTPSPPTLYVNYTAPLVTSYPVYAAFNPSAGGTVTASMSTNLGLPSSMVERVYPNGTLEVVSRGTVSTVSTLVQGNYSYKLTMSALLVPGTPYIANFNVNDLTAALARRFGQSYVYPGAAQLAVMPVSGTVRVWTGVTAVSPTITAVATRVLTTAATGPDWARVCWLFTFNRPLAYSLDGSGNLVGFPLPLSAFTGTVYGPNPNITMTPAGASGAQFTACANVAAARPPNSVSLSAPAAPTATVTDAGGVIVYGGPWAAPAVVVTFGLRAAISAVSQDAGAGTVTFAVAWNYPLSNSSNTSFVPDTDLICGNCVNFTWTQDGVAPQNYTVVAVAADVAQPVTLSLNASTAACDAEYAWNTPVDVALATASAQLPAGATPSGTPTPSTTPTPSSTASLSATPTCTPTPSGTGSDTPTPSTTASTGGSASSTPTPSVTATGTGTPTTTVSTGGSASSTPTPSATPTGTGTGTATGTPSPSASAAPHVAVAVSFVLAGAGPQALLSNSATLGRVLRAAVADAISLPTASVQVVQLGYLANLTAVAASATASGPARNASSLATNRTALTVASDINGASGSLRRALQYTVGSTTVNATVACSGVDTVTWTDPAPAVYVELLLLVPATGGSGAVGGTNTDFANITEVARVLRALFATAPATHTFTTLWNNCTRGAPGAAAPAGAGLGAYMAVEQVTVPPAVNPPAILGVAADSDTSTVVRIAVPVAVLGVALVSFLVFRFVPGARAACCVCYCCGRAGGKGEGASAAGAANEGQRAAQPSATAGDAPEDASADGAGDAGGGRARAPGSVPIRTVIVDVQVNAAASAVADDEFSLVNPMVGAVGHQSTSAGAPARVGFAPSGTGGADDGTAATADSAGASGQ